MNSKRTKTSDPVAQPMDFFQIVEPTKCEQDLDKLYAGVEYTLRMCEASMRNANGIS